MRAVVLAMWLLALAAAPAVADTLTVTPSTGLARSGQGVQVSSSGSYSGSVYLVEAAHVGGKTYCNAAYLGRPPAAPYPVTFYAYGRIRRVGAFTSGDPCKDPAAPEWTGAPPTADVPCDPTPPASTTCAIEMRSASTGEVLASAPIDFDFPPPVCHDLFTGTHVNEPVFVEQTVGCSDPNNRRFVIEILDGPHHGTLAPPPANGERKYTPANRYVGPDEFTVQAVIGDQRSNVATVHISVRPPDYGGPRVNYFVEYSCGGFGRRSFAFAFRPAGGRGRGTPPSFTAAKYPLPFNPLTLADAARPHLSVYSGKSWVAYADTAALALPGNGKGCTGPAGPLVLQPRIVAPVKATGATDLRCKFNSKFSYIGLFGTRGGGTAPAVRRAVAFEIIVKNGQVKGYRTALIATLGGARKSLAYDRQRCSRSG